MIIFNEQALPFLQVLLVLVYEQSGVAAPSLQEEGSGDMPISHSYGMECGSRAGLLS